MAAFSPGVVRISVTWHCARHGGQELWRLSSPPKFTM
jgi:hypothetical protein